MPDEAEIYRDSDGEIWEETGDGNFRLTYTDGSYREEESFQSLDLWRGPLTEVEQT